MATHAKPTELVKFNVSPMVKGLSHLFVVVGVAAFAFGLTKDPQRAWTSYLTAFFFFASLGIGGLFFTAIQHVTNAHWSVTVRRYAEAMTAFLPIAAILGIIFVLFGAEHLYQWLNPDLVASDVLLQKKVAYLNKNFFTIRMVVFFALWLWFAKVIVSRSLNQDQSGDEKLTLKNVGSSVRFLLVFAITYSLFGVDLLMSLDPHWYSTMFGVYCFAGLFQSTLAALILITLWIKKSGKIDGVVNENHLHDLGKFLFAFTIFYAYIGFSQFMLIWYANIPEETLYFVHRSHGVWFAISMSLLALKFLVPFLALMTRGSKRNPKVLVPVALLILVMQYVDNYWLVYPNFNEGHAAFSLTEVGVFLGFLGLFVVALSYFLGRFSVVPVKDPRLEESLHHHI